MSGLTHIEETFKVLATGRRAAFMPFLAAGDPDLKTTAELIVAVGTHFNLIEFMERNRAGMASTFVTRLKVGESLVDAKGVSRLVSPRIGVWPLVTFAVAGISAVVVAVLVSPALRNVIQSLARSIGDALGL